MRLHPNLLNIKRLHPNCVVNPIWTLTVALDIVFKYITSKSSTKYNLDFDNF